MNISFVPNTDHQILVLIKDPTSIDVDEFFQEYRSSILKASSKRKRVLFDLRNCAYSNITDTVKLANMFKSNGQEFRDHIDVVVICCTWANVLRPMIPTGKGEVDVVFVSKAIEGAKILKAST